MSGFLGESLLNDGAAIFLFEMFAEYRGQQEVPFGSNNWEYDALEVRASCRSLLSKLVTI